jgi:hypothetical protein
MFRKFAEIFASQGAPTVSTTAVANLPPVSTTPAANFPPFSLVLLIPVANLPPVSMIPAENLPPVSTTLVANCHWYQRYGGKFATWLKANCNFLIGGSCSFRSCRCRLQERVSDLKGGLEWGTLRIPHKDLLYSWSTFT